MLIALLITLVLQRRQNLLGAGIALSLLLVEPQVVWLALPMLVAARQWRTLLGFAVGVLAWLLASLVLVGPAQLARWPAFLLQTHVGDAFRGVGLPAFAASITNSGSTAFLTSAVLAAAAFVLAYVLRRRLRQYPAHALASVSSSRWSLRRTSMHRTSRCSRCHALWSRAGAETRLF